MQHTKYKSPSAVGTSEMGAYFRGAVLCAIFAWTAPLAAKDADKDPCPGLSPAAQHAFALAEKVTDPGVRHHLVRLLGSEQLLELFYSESLYCRLVALDAAGVYEQNPWTLLPSLAALMGARDRDTASISARSLLELLTRIEASPEKSWDVVPGQKKQLMGQLAALASDIRLDVDVRHAAISGYAMILKSQKSLLSDTPWVLSLLEDPYFTVRRAALTTIDLPVAAPLLIKLAELAQEDTDPMTRGQATALLCENAVFHGVRAPSADLTRILKDTLGNTELPADALAPSLACLRRFPVSARTDLIDLALSHPDPALTAFWKELND